MHRAKIAPRECGWKHGDSGHSAGEKLWLRKRTQNPLDSDRPSHGRRFHSLTPSDARFQRDHRLDVSTTALVEVTSEEKDHPIESALIAGASKGWRAAEPGTHTIRLIFDRPQTLKRISLVFEEKETSRTQEFVLRWSPSQEGSFREIVRQQWNFSPPRTTNEVE